MAYDNLTFETSVANALRAAGPDGGLYRENGKIGQETLRKISPDGKERNYIMGEIDYSDLKTMADELDVVLRLQDPLIQSLFAKNARQIAEMVRVVNYNTRSGFKGSTGSGNALDQLMFRAEQFQSPDAAGILARTTWLRAVGIGPLQMICAADALGANTHAAYTVAANEALAILGFANTAAAPCTSAFSFTYIGQPYNVQNLQFELASIVYGDVVVELKQPLFVMPGETILLNTYYYQAGNDELRPIGLWVKTANLMRALATS